MSIFALCLMSCGGSSGGSTATTPTTPTDPVDPDIVTLHGVEFNITTSLASLPSYYTDETIHTYTGYGDVAGSTLLLSTSNISYSTDSGDTIPACYELSSVDSVIGASHYAMGTDNNIYELDYDNDVNDSISAIEYNPPRLAYPIEVYTTGTTWSYDTATYVVVNGSETSPNLNYPASVQIEISWTDQTYTITQWLSSPSFTPREMIFGGTGSGGYLWSGNTILAPEGVN